MIKLGRFFFRKICYERPGGKIPQFERILPYIDEKKMYNKDVQLSGD